jgi:hypothetical protein
MRRLEVSMGSRFGKYGDAKRKGLIRKNRLREKNMFKTYARSARTSKLPFVSSLCGSACDIYHEWVG